MKTALITGITGQDGSYLAEFLLDKGYKVVGMVRRTSSPSLSRIQHLLGKIELVQVDLTDQSSLVEALRKHNPNDIYNLAAQSYVPTSWNQPVLTGEIDALGVTKILEAIRNVNPKIRFYQASSSEMFGGVQETPQSEKTPFYPRSPYGIAKLYAYWITVNYRESYDMFCCNGILFNHESPRRGSEFVSKKVIEAVVKIYYGHQKVLKLGNLEARRDWGFAGDYVEAMWMMLQQDKPDDYVIATGVSHTVRDLCEIAFARLGLNWQRYVEVDSSQFRLAEVYTLEGDSSKARAKLGWKPKTSFKELIEYMVDKEKENYED